MEGPKGSEKVLYSAATGGFFGAVVGSVESVWAIPKLGAQLPKFATQVKHVGSRALLFAVVGGIYATGEYVAEGVRQKSGPMNAAVGGFVAGMVPGILTKNARTGAASCVAASVLMGASDLWGSSQVSSFEKYEAARLADRA